MRLKNGEGSTYNRQCCQNTLIIENVALLSIQELFSRLTEQCFSISRGWCRHLRNAGQWEGPGGYGSSCHTAVWRPAWTVTLHVFGLSAHNADALFYCRVIFFLLDITVQSAYVCNVEYIVCCDWFCWINGRRTSHLWFATSSITIQLNFLNCSRCFHGSGKPRNEAD